MQGETIQKKLKQLKLFFFEQIGKDKLPNIKNLVKNSKGLPPVSLSNLEKSLDDQGPLQDSILDAPSSTASSPMWAKEDETFQEEIEIKPQIKEVLETLIDSSSIITSEDVFFDLKRASQFPIMILTNVNEKAGERITYKFLSPVEKIAEIKGIKMIFQKGLRSALILFNRGCDIKKIAEIVYSTGKNEKQLFLGEFQMLWIQEEEDPPNRYIVVLRDLPKEFTTRSLLVYLEQKFPTIHFVHLEQLAEIKGSLCTQVNVASIEEAETLCNKLNKTKQKEAIQFKVNKDFLDCQAHLHPLTYQLKRKIKKSIFGTLLPEFEAQVEEIEENNEWKMPFLLNLSPKGTIFCDFEKTKKMETGFEAIDKEILEYSEGISIDDEIELNLPEIKRDPSSKFSNFIEKSMNSPKKTSKEMTPKRRNKKMISNFSDFPDPEASKKLFISNNSTILQQFPEFMAKTQASKSNPPNTAFQHTQMLPQSFNLNQPQQNINDIHNMHNLIKQQQMPLNKQILSENSKNINQISKILNENTQLLLKNAKPTPTQIEMEKQPIRFNEDITQDKLNVSLRNPTDLSHRNQQFQKSIQERQPFPPEILQITSNTTNFDERKGISRILNPNLIQNTIQNQKERQNSKGNFTQSSLQSQNKRLPVSEFNNFTFHGQENDKTKEEVKIQQKAQCVEAGSQNNLISEPEIPIPLPSDSPPHPQEADLKVAINKLENQGKNAVNTFLDTLNEEIEAQKPKKKINAEVLEKRRKALSNLKKND